MEGLLVAGPGTCLGGKACSLSAWLWVIPPRGSGSTYASTHLSHEPGNVSPAHWPFPARPARHGMPGLFICLVGTSNYGPIRPDLVSHDCPRHEGDAESLWLIRSEKMRLSFRLLVFWTGARDPIRVLDSLPSNRQTVSSSSKQAIHS